MRSVIRHLATGALTVVIFPALCFAQFGAIAGVMRDGSGAVLPGVTVEAASPALIEKTRMAVSDSAGQYKVEQLRPGVYTVTFTLTGFKTVRREGIEISAGFTAPLNASLQIGAVEETVTVTGEAPVVDVQGVSQQKTLGKEALEALPTARSFATLGTTLPGVTANQRDVGGTQGERGNVLSAHGGAPGDMTLQIDGISIGNSSPNSGGQAWSTFSLNDAAVQEIAFETGAISAEAAGGGVRVNVIPQEGGNTLRGSIFGNFATREMSRSNYTDELQARGLRAPTGYDRLWDASAGVGGPIRRDRLWFFYANRYRGNDVRGTDAYYEMNPQDFVYDADTSRPIHQGGWDLDNQVRVTAQLSQRNKVSGFFDKINKCNCPTVFAGPTTVGQSSTRLTYPSTWMTAFTWQSMVGTKLLWDSALAYDRQQSLFGPQPDAGVSPTAPLSALESTTQRRLRAPFTANGEDLRQYNSRGSLSFVTGSHAAKVGFTMHTGARDATTYAYSDATSLTLFNGQSQSITMSTAPYTQTQNINADLGIYATERWTLRRLTLTGGIRFDYFNSSIPEQSAPAARWIGARSFAEVPNVPNWKDVSPRLGASYDLFGTGRTAIKVSVNRYVTGAVYAFTTNLNPFQTSVNMATRSWNDFNGNFIPEGDPLNPLPNGEFTGTLSNLNFGKSIVTTRVDPDVSEGWAKRPYNWEYSASVQHELMPRVSMEVGYFRRRFGNQTVTDNLDVTPADYNEFCITAPTDPRLGSVSGSRICGLYDVTPTKAGIASNQVIRFAKDYPGETSRTFNGVDLSVNLRPTRGLFLQAGVSTGQTVTKDCAVPGSSSTSGTQVDNPATLRFCEVKPPYMGNYRVSGGYMFPGGVQVSGVFQSLPPDLPAGVVPGGVPSVATLQVRTNPEVLASLGRPIATPGGVISVPLIDPSRYADFGERVNQVDLRVTKGFRVGRYRIEAIADFYNVFNVSTILTYTATYAVNPTTGVNTWSTPASILQSSFVKLGGRLTF
jgi:hypothetical protein